MCNVRKNKSTLNFQVPPAASFQDRPLTIFLKNSSVYDLKVNLFLMEDFCFNLIILGLDYVSI